MFDNIHFETIIEGDILGHGIDAKIEYKAERDYKSVSYGERCGWDITVLSVKYFCMGTEVKFEGVLNSKLEAIAEEAAEEHFFETKEAA